MGSTRLPGKVLAEIAGRPMLQLMLERLLPLDVEEVVVATTTDPRDDPVVEVTSSMGIRAVRGPEADVLGRYVQAVAGLEPDAVIRLTADCPLTDARLVRQVLDHHEAVGADYTTNTLPRTFPKGLDVEVIRHEALLLAHERAQPGPEREHVTPYLYRHPETFRLANVTSGALLGSYWWTVDTPQDLQQIRQLVAAMGGSTFRWEEALSASQRLPPEPGLRLRPALEADSQLLFDLRNDDMAIRTSGSGRGVTPDEHMAWFADRFANPATQLWVVEDERGAIGQVRVDVEDAVGTVSMAISPAWRGEGAGRAALAALQDTTRTAFQVVTLRALVQPAHEASLGMFGAAGFDSTGRTPGGLIELRWEVEGAS